MELSAVRHPYPCREKSVTYVTHRGTTDALAKCRSATVPIQPRQPVAQHGLSHARTTCMIDS